MDHIPPPKNAPSNVFKVPFLARIEYDREGFESFPYRKEFTFDNDIQHPEDVASFIQAWMYFGLLVECIQQPVDPLLFIIHETRQDGTVEQFISSALGLRDLKLSLAKICTNDVYRIYAN
jgi:hypothetical protein